MLSSALQKANTAVLLDNANNFEGAMEAYGDACVLLGHVMMRAGVEDDRRKLMIIRDTYSRRIEELKALSPKYRVNEKELPARPESDDFSDPDTFDEGGVPTTSAPADKNAVLPPRRDSLLPTSAGFSKGASRFRGRESRHQDIPEEASTKESFEEVRPNVHRGTMGQQLPAVRDEYAVGSGLGQISENNKRTSNFKHHRSSSGIELGSRETYDISQTYAGPESAKARMSFRPVFNDLQFDQQPKSSVLASQNPQQHHQQQQQQQQHIRGDSEVSTSWLNTVDESGGSMSESSSRTGSRTGSRPGSSRSRIRKMRMAAKQDKFGPGGQDNEAEVIGAEIDAAVDAAWDAFSSDAESEQNVGILMRETDQDIEHGGGGRSRIQDRKDSDILLDHDSDLFGHDKTGVKAGEEFGTPLLSRENIEESREGSTNGDDEAHSYENDHRRTPLQRDSQQSEGSLISRPAQIRSLDTPPPLRTAQNQFGKAQGLGTPRSITSDEEDERVLYDTKDNYQLDDFNFEVVSKSNVPRESTSSGVSASTWGSSMASTNGLNPGPPLQTVTEMSTEALEPERSESPSIAPLSGAKAPSAVAGVRDRRSGRPLSGITGPLTIDINSAAPKSTSAPEDSAFEDGIEIGTATTSPGTVEIQPLSTHPISTHPLPPIPSPPHIIPKSANQTASSSRPSSGIWNENDDQSRSYSKAGLRDDVETSEFVTVDAPPSSNYQKLDYEEDEVTLTDSHLPGSPASKLAPRAPGVIRHIQSSQSLKHRTIATPEPDISSPMIPTLNTSASSSNLRGLKGPPLAINYAGGSYPSIPTAGLPTGGFHLFDSKMYSPLTPGTPSAGGGSSAPVPLEAMPSDTYAKPFWLMRCFYQTITHPRGGYLSSRLFVPREVWIMKGVKLKAIDEKIAACESLTATLAKLAAVDKTTDDMNNAEVLLSESQELETIMERTQATLSKKLGNEVGATGVQNLFKSDGGGQEHSMSSSDAGKSTGGTSGGKSSFSWKKLRSKNSTSAINSAFSSSHASYQPGTPIEPPSSAADSYGMSGGGGTEGGDMSVRRVGNSIMSGPHAPYVAALANLFDAAQILDRILLRLDPNETVDKTQVGLRLVMERGAEFFGVIVCRFVLADIALLLDKYIKRGTEWTSM